MKFLAAAALTFAATCAQSLPQFEVASLKPAPEPHNILGWSGGPGSPNPTLFRCQNCTPAMLVALAYEISPHQFSGPAWAESTHFNIDAKLPPNSTKQQFRQMVQQLLAERFLLTFHRETKELRAYELVIAKGGHKLHLSSAPASVDEQDKSVEAFRQGKITKDDDGFPVLPPGRAFMMVALDGGRTAMRCAHESMASFANRLSAQLNQPVKDLTGLTGQYDFTLYWIQDEAASASGPTLHSALPAQLGLKLDSKRTAVEMFVVDHLEKSPTAN